MTGTTAPLFHQRFILLLAMLVILAAQTLIAVTRSDELGPQTLFGPDSYTRMLRVEKLFQTGDWYDRVSERTNAPYGETLHWGRPLDGILFAVTGLFKPFTDLRTAVYSAGLIIGPLFALLMIPAWSWGTRPFLGNGVFLMILVLTALAPHLITNLRAGRADHHGFLALLFVIQLASTFRLATGAKGRGPAIILGLAGGMAIWASVVGWVAQAIFACVLAYLYVLREKRSTRDFVLYTAGLAAMLTIALPLERPLFELTVVDFKRLSIVHWALAGSAAATWVAIHGISRLRPSPETMRAKFITLALGGGIPLAVIAILFPKFFLGPLVDLDPEVAAAFLASVAEFRPLFPSRPDDIGMFFMFLGPVFFGLGFILYDVRGAEENMRFIYYSLLTGLAIYLPLALMIGRFALYAQILALVPWAMATARIMTWTRTVRIWRWRVPIRAFAVILAIVGPSHLGIVFRSPAPASSTRTDKSDWVAIGNFLKAYAAQNEIRTNGDPILFTYLFRGPEIVWRTPFRVVGAPYDNADAIQDTYDIFRAKTDEAAWRVVSRRGITFILYCRDEVENRLYRKEKTVSFLSRIENGAIPEWLSPVTLPDTLSAQFKLFRVVAKH